MVLHLRGPLMQRDMCFFSFIALIFHAPSPQLPFSPPTDTGHELWFNGGCTGEGSARLVFFVFFFKLSGQKDR